MAVSPELPSISSMATPAAALGAFGLYHSPGEEGMWQRSGLLGCTTHPGQRGHGSWSQNQLPPRSSVPAISTMNAQPGMQDDSLETYFDRSVEIKITNESQDVTLHSPRSYCFSGHSLLPPSPRILPGSKESCLFTKGRYSFRGSVGLLVYNSDAFTLAIMFSNPFDYNLYSVEFGIEISPGKDHLGNLEEVYERMYNYTPTNSCTTFKKAKLGQCQEALVVTAGHIRVVATMSNAAKAVIKVLVEEKGSPPPYSKNLTYCKTHP